MKRQGLPKVNDRSKGKGCLVLTVVKRRMLTLAAGRGPGPGSGDSTVSATRCSLALGVRNVLRHVQGEGM